MSALDTQIAYFEEHRDEFVSKHHHEFVVIYNETPLGFYTSRMDAYTAAKKACPPGEFLLRQCLTPEEEPSRVFYSRVA